MPDLGLVRPLVALVLAAGTAFAIDRLTAARGFDPPGFAQPWRRLAAMTVVAAILVLAVFLPIVSIGVEHEIDLDAISGPRLFLLHILLTLTVVTWFVLGYAGRPGVGAAFARQLGLSSARPWTEVGIGLAAGIVGWGLALLLMMLVAMVIYLAGGEALLPQAPPPMVEAIASLPLLVLVGVALSAGIVEELFFRGFLQPRVGIALSTALFVLGHTSYEQPFMLVGITALSLLFAFLVRWRRGVLAAIVAHATFDMIQLVIVIPWVLRKLPELGPALP